MTDFQFATALAVLLNDADVVQHPVTEDDVEVCVVESYEERGVLTNNAGLVVRLYTGEVFHITVVRN